MAKYYTNGDGDVILDVADGSLVDSFLEMSTGFTDFNKTGNYASEYMRAVIDPGGRLASVSHHSVTQSHLVETYYDNTNIPTTNEFVAANQYGLLKHGPILTFTFGDNFGNRVEQHFTDGRLNELLTNHGDGSFTIQRFDQFSQLVHYDSYSFDGNPTRTAENSTFFFKDNNGQWWQGIFDDNGFVGNINVGPLFVTSTIVADASGKLGGTINPGFYGNNGAALIGFDVDARLIIRDGAALIGQDGASLIGQDGASLIGQDGASLIGQDGASIVGYELKNGNFSPFFSDNGSGLIGQDAASLIGQDGASLIGQDGASFGNNAARVAGLDFVRYASVISDKGSGLSGPTFVENLAAGLFLDAVGVHSYIANALAFADSNENGLYDPGEDWTLTDANGQFELFGSGPVVVVGGTDTGTQLPFVSKLTAPLGSTVVSPLTTVVNQILSNGGTFDEAHLAVKQAFGLDVSIDLTTLDPIAGTQGGSVASADALIAGFQVLVTVEMIAAALAGVSGNLRTSTNDSYAAIANAIGQSGGIDLTNPAAIEALVTTVAQNQGIDTGFVAALAALIASNNTNLEELKSLPISSLLNESFAYLSVAEGHVLSALEAAAGNASVIAAIDFTDAAATDFNGDGRSDILWQHTNGAITEWLMNGTSFTQSGLIGGGGDPKWRVVSSGDDFNGDGKADLLWQHTNGTVTLWFMDGSSFSQPGLIGGGGDPNWKIKGTGDFNGDSLADIVWQHSGGGVVLWLGKGGGDFTQTPVIGSSSGPGLEIEATGDINGDGRDDLLWQDANNGAVSAWLMNGTSFQAINIGGTGGDPNWDLRASGDFNGDGKDDVVLQHASGAVSVWLLDGANITPSGLIGGNGDANWEVKGTGDYDNDGRADLIWQQHGTGAVFTWQMNGFNFAPSGLIGGGGDSNWQVIALG